jgi:aryl-alcohol dehydrogenase-like predicted oxidoreductase
VQRRKLGKNGPEVGAVGLGCMSFGGIYGATDMAESHRTLARALDLGVDHLDTANIYGEGVAEEVIGAFVKDHPNRFTIATKAGIKNKPVRGFDNSPEHLRASLEASLKRLGVDHVALFYVHRREQSRPIEDVMETLVRLKDEGKIGAIGLSEISPATLERANAVHHVAAIQNEYSLWTRLPELGLLQATKRLGTALVAFSPVGRGMFSSTPVDPARFGEGDFRRLNPRFIEPNFGYNSAYVAKFAAFAKARGLSPATLAIAWTLARGDHVIPIPGTRSAAHLEEDAAAADVVLSPADLDAIEAILPVGFAHGDRYSEGQANGPERYC